jgi:MFS transporter, DHA1 family, multidrug resistance protein
MELVGAGRVRASTLQTIRILVITNQSPVAPAQKQQGIREFIALMAALMACNALAIDAMLPALPAIGAELGVADDNQRQLVITTYLLGFGAGQILYGPLSDRFGRKGILIFCLGFYVACAVLAGIAQSFSLLLAARAAQGLSAAATRVLAVAIIRDRFAGEGMARVMSLVMIVFMVVPIIAPFYGQAVLAVASWHFIFIGLGIYAAAVMLWGWARLPETLPPERRRPLSLTKIREAVATTLTNRHSIGNTIALTLVMGGLFSFINSIQQIVFDVFGEPDLLPLAFGAIGIFLASASFLNSRIVEKVGSRRIALIALTVYTTMAAIHLAVALLFEETLILFILLQAMTMAAFGLIGANLGSIAMQPLGHIAGTASSVQGLMTTIGGALIGYAVGQAFDGTQIPFLVGTSLCGLAALAVAFWANREVITA